MLAHKFAHLGNIARLPVNVRSRDPSVPLVLDFPLPIASTRLRAPNRKSAIENRKIGVLFDPLLAASYDKASIFHGSTRLLRSPARPLEAPPALICNFR